MSYERSPGFLIHDLAGLMRLSFERRVREIGLTRAQWFVLAHIVRGDGKTQTELAEATDMERAPLGKLLDRLAEGGWIERRSDPADRRLKRIYLTEKIVPLMPIAGRASEQVFNIAFAGMDAADRERLIDGLVLMRGNLLRDKAESERSGG